MTPDELDPQEEAVRRLLAEAGRDPGPVPADVASRLDDTLARLQAERAAGGSTGATAEPVVLAERRRRRWPQVLVAAAAVSVISVGAANLFSGGEAELSTAGDAGEARVQVAPEDSSGGAASGAQEAQPDAAAPSGDTAAAAGPRLSRGSLKVDIQRIEDFRLAAPAQQFRQPQAPGSDDCATPRVGRGDSLLRVRLDGQPSVLVLRKPVDGARLAEVFGCDDATSPVARTTVRTR